MIKIAGGVYTEKCIEPEWYEFYGSGGRAAAALGWAGDVELYTYHPVSRQPELDAFKLAYGIEIKGEQVDQEIAFSYFHPLAVPEISPRPDAIKEFKPIHVSGDSVIRFGMMEGSAIVQAGRVVFDPQSAYNPQLFSANGSEADELAIVLNEREALKLAGTQDVGSAIKYIQDHDRPDVVVLKQGSHGATVHFKGEQQRVPAYKSENVWTVGSGDIFSAAFGYYWGLQKRDPAEAADAASRATSYYCNSRSLPMVKDEDDVASLSPVIPAVGMVYLAAPFFNLGERYLVEQLRNSLLHMGVEVFSPIHDVGVGPAEFVAEKDLEGLDSCNCVLAVLNGADLGTSFEIGYAVSKGIPVVALAQNMRLEDLKMPEGAGCRIVNDIVSAVYHSIWSL